MILKKWNLGINLQNACEIFFIDSSFDDTQHQQAWSRIHRYSTKHKKLQATFVYTKDTISEKIFNFHKKIRDGETIDTATKVFKQDNPHTFDKEITIYRSFSDVDVNDKESYGDIYVKNIDEESKIVTIGLNLNCDFKHYINIKYILLKSIYISKLLKFDFNQILESKLKLTENNFKSFKDAFISKKKSILYTNNSKIFLIDHNNSRKILYKKNKIVVEIKSCHCSICSFRQIKEDSIQMRFVGEFNKYVLQTVNSEIPIYKFYNIINKAGIIDLKYYVPFHSRLSFHDNKKVILITPEFKEFEEMKPIKTITNNLYYSKLNNTFFDIYFKLTKIMIVLKNDIKLGDSIKLSDTMIKLINFLSIQKIL